MPYIREDKRDELEGDINSLLVALADQEDGCWNYAITRIILARPRKRYKEIQDTVGLLRCILGEFERRVLVPYERKKRKENGDVL